MLLLKCVQLVGNRLLQHLIKIELHQRNLKAKASESVNDGSYLRVQKQVPVSTVTSTSQACMSASIGQTIRDMLNKLVLSNQKLSRRIDRFERNGSISSIPLISPTAPQVSHSKGVAIPQKPTVCSQALPKNFPTVTTGSAEDHGSNTTPMWMQGVSNDATDAIVLKAEVLKSIPTDG